MQGMEVIPHKEVAYTLPENVDGMGICLKLTGGVGDGIVALGSSAKYLNDTDNDFSPSITLAVFDHHRELMSHFKGVDNVIQSKDLNNPKIRNSFDVIISFDGTFNNSRELLRKDYYTLVSERLGRDVSLASFDFEKETSLNRVVALHPGASNPNRRWNKTKWKELAYELASRDYTVIWLGTSDEYGFTDISNKIYKASDISNRLYYQAVLLSSCTLFVGNDSGFCHIAGILGIPGGVIFGATHPNDVIARYPTLVGIHTFEDYESPTRTLRGDDTKSKVYLDNVTVEQVLKELKLEAHVCTPGKETRPYSRKSDLYICGTIESAELLNLLIESYNLGWVGDAEIDNYFPVLVLKEKRVYVKTAKGEFNVNIIDTDNFLRALRTLINGS